MLKTNLLLRNNEVGIQQTLLGNTTTTVNVVANPSTVFRVRTSAGVLSETIVLSASGGIPPYTWNTVWLSGGAGITIGSPTSSTIVVSANRSPYTSLSGTLLSTATDSQGNTGSVSISVTLVWEI